MEVAGRRFWIGGIKRRRPFGGALQPQVLRILRGEPLTALGNSWQEAE